MLNREQREAVTCEDGPVLVLAGAGSGKTRVLIHRIAYLIAMGRATPDSIMAVTFTNKAANEMKERLQRLAGYDLNHCWIGTFHSLGARILRKEAAHLGMERNFNIYDPEDSLNCIKLIMEELNLSTERFAPKAIAWAISNAKNAFLNPEQMRLSSESELYRTGALVYEKYQNVLKQNNAVDFDDLLMLPVILFENEPTILQYYQEKFQYIMVDEYQDTNRAQYYFLQLLAANHRNLFVVGDDDQSIYRWRGADLRNILDFNEDYPECRVIRLEQNYRSTKIILDAAHSVVVHNKGRHPKKLWTNKATGEKVHLLQASSERAEAELIVRKINEEFSRNKRNLRDFVILYRTNAQSRVLEEAFRRAGIPYVIVGGIRFYERKEIKDVLAYLRVVANPLDTVNLRRIINYPLRGIGEATLSKIQHYALEHNLSLFEALGQADRISGISPRLQTTIRNFYDFIAKYIQLKEKISLTELANSLVEETGILQKFKLEGTPDAFSRIENIRELQNAISEYAQSVEHATLEGFLEQIALISDIDNWDDRSNVVSLMTLHSAKGLEFPVVFICGLEEGLFPLSRNMETREDIEEERRLFYVGVTRAKEKLYLSYARARKMFGDYKPGKPSRFLEEIDQSLLEVESSDPYYRTRGRVLQKERAYVPEPEETPQIMPDYENYSQEQTTLMPGMRIFHSHFGEGVIKTISGRGEKTKIVVDFEDNGVKTIMVKYASIQIL